MKPIERVIALAALVLFVTVSSSVFAQTDHQMVINIPFNFTVGDKAMNAGTYEVRPNRKDSDLAWVIQNKETGKAAIILTRPVHANDTQENAKLVFRRYDDLYILSEFWGAGTNTGREIQVTDRERALTKALAVNPTVHVLIDRGGR